MIVGRLEYERGTNYCNKVLLGKWSEDRSAYKKHVYRSTTTYAAHYPPKPYSANDPGCLWDNKFQNEGCGPRIMFDHDGQKYVNNLSTTYDLSYNHFTKFCDGPHSRHFRTRFLRYEPQQDFTKNFGAATKYGLTKRKKEQWRCENMDPRLTVASEYDDIYVAPRPKDYAFKHWAVPLPNSSKKNKRNDEMLALRLRGEFTPSLATLERLIEVPTEKTCNPITWDCPDEIKQPRRCIPSRRT